MKHILLDWIVFEDDPVRHKRLKTKALPFFAPQVVSTYSPLIEDSLERIFSRVGALQIVASIYLQIGNRSRFDFHSEVAVTLPLFVIMQLLGFDLDQCSLPLTLFVLLTRSLGEQYYPKVHKFVDSLSALLGSGVTDGAEEVTRQLLSILEDSISHVESFKQRYHSEEELKADKRPFGGNRSFVFVVSLIFSQPFFATIYLIKKRTLAIYQISSPRTSSPVMRPQRTRYSSLSFRDGQETSRNGSWPPSHKS